MGSTPASEKNFYLQHFRRRSLVFHLPAGGEVDEVRPVLDELVANQTLVVVSVSRKAAGCDAIEVRDSSLGSGAGLVDLTASLLADCIAFAGRADRLGAVRGLEFSCRLATRLAAHKVVVVDSRGGLPDGQSGDTRSFVKASSLASIGRSAKSAGGWQSDELKQIGWAIKHGVESVNLTRAAELAAELFTYEGAGTLVTEGEYARVDRLGVDDFAEALALLERGEREGFLLPRSSSERAEILLCGYGVRLEGRRLAGVAGLRSEPYKRQKLAEVVGLYAITRFQGEGVGVRLLEVLVDAARDSGRKAVFACTSNSRAAAFFLRNGFAEVDAGRAPSIKWKGRRRPRPDTVYWREI